MKSFFALFGLCMLLTLIGCTTQTKTPADNKSPAEPDKKDEKSKVKTPSDKNTVELKVAKLSEFEDFLKRQKGKIVVIDFWATWSAPSKTSFPQHVELHNKYNDKDVVCMSVSLDEIENKDKARQFLEKNKAAFANFLPDEDELAWRKHWDIGLLPATMVYDSTGNIHRFTNAYDNGKGFTPADVEKLVEKLVKE